MAEITNVGSKLYIPYKTWGKLYHPGKLQAALLRRGMDLETARIIDQSLLDALEDVAFKEEANYRAIEDWQTEVVIPETGGRGARRHLSTSQSILNNTETEVKLDADSFTDSYGFYQSAITPYGLVVPVDFGGLYVIAGAYAYDPNTTGDRWGWISINGIRYAADTRRTLATVAKVHGSYLTIARLTDGDIVRLYVRQTSGGSLPLSGSSPHDNWLSLLRIGN